MKQPRSIHWRKISIDVDTDLRYSAPSYIHDQVLLSGSRLIESITSTAARRSSLVDLDKSALSESFPNFDLQETQSGKGLNRGATPGSFPRCHSGVAA